MAVSGTVITMIPEGFLQGQGSAGHHGKLFPEGNLAYLRTWNVVAVPPVKFNNRKDEQEMRPWT